jgi:plastocyanin
MKHHHVTFEWRALAAMATVATAVALVAVARTPAATTAAVGIKDFTFSPTTLTVPVGTTVTWTNHDEVPHTITSAVGAFGSSGLSHEETFAQTFTKGGTYQYFCSVHPRMRATVIVK